HITWFNRFRERRIVACMFTKSQLGCRDLLGFVAHRELLHDTGVPPFSMPIAWSIPMASMPRPSSGKGSSRLSTIWSCMPGRLDAT
ncbi:MAG: hypothetical protein V3R80_14140, partial [Candidatus Tectomicrobia bacterium]